MPFWQTLFGTPPSLVELIAAVVIAIVLAFRARPKQGTPVLSVYVAVITIFLEQARILPINPQMPLNFIESVMSVTLGHVFLLVLWAAFIIFPIRRYVLNQKGKRVFTRR